MENIELKIVLLDHYGDHDRPFYATEHSAGIDLIAAIQEDILLTPYTRVLIPNGLKLEIPTGYEGQVRSRSGLAYKHGVVVLNSPGTIDSDYRGEIKTLLINLSDTDFMVKPGMRISQLVIAPIQRAQLNLTTALDNTTRGAGGFGSTGM